MCFARFDLVFLIRVPRRVVGSALGLKERGAGAAARINDMINK